MLFASSFTIGKAVLTLVDPIFCIGIRMTIAGILLLAYWILVKKGSIRIPRQDWWLFVLIALFHIYIAYITEFWALQYVASAKACLLYNLSPFITSLCTYAFYKTRLGLQKCIGLLIGFMGFIPILITSVPEELMMGHWGRISFPELVLLISVVSSVCGWLVFKNLITKHGYTPIVINGVGMMVGGIAALVTSFLVEGIPHIGASGSAEEIILFLQYTTLMILIANIVGYNLYGYLLHYYSPTLLSFFGFTTPLFAALYGFIFLNEPILPSFIISTLLVSIGLYLFYRQELKEIASKKT